MLMRIKSGDSVAYYSLPEDFDIEKTTKDYTNLITNILKENNFFNREFELIIENTKINELVPTLLDRLRNESYVTAYKKDIEKILIVSDLLLDNTLERYILSIGGEIYTGEVIDFESSNNPKDKNFCFEVFLDRVNYIRDKKNLDLTDKYKCRTIEAINEIIVNRNYKKGVDLLFEATNCKKTLQLD